MTTRKLPDTANYTRAEYEAIPALSYSGMKELARSPAHYQAWLADKLEEINNRRLVESGMIEKSDEKETKAFRIGKAVHCAFLQPDLWAKTYKAIPECDRRTKEGKAVHEAFMSSLNDGDTALPFDEYELATEVAQSAERISDAHIVRTGAWAEVPLTAKDLKTPIKGIPDLIDGDGFIFDLKTTDDATERAVLRTILQYGYHLQAAHYLNLASAHIDGLKGFRLIFVEKTKPYAGAVYEISADLLDLGRKTVAGLYQTYDKCVAENNWPGLPDHVTKLDALPGAKKTAPDAGITF